MEFEGAYMYIHMYVHVYVHVHTHVHTCVCTCMLLQTPPFNSPLSYSSACTLYIRTCTSVQPSKYYRTRGFSIDQLKGKQLFPTFQLDTLVVFRAKV